MMSNDAMTELSRLLAGRFQLEHVLGAGEHTEIYAAISVKKTARRFALKCYKPSGEAERYMVSGLLQRAGATLELRHENIIGVHGYILEKDYYIIVMDIADGHDAATYLKKFGPLSTYDAWMTARGVLTGLAHAHGQGIIHGNLKPANIFLPMVAEAPVLIGDFRLGALGWNSTTTIYAAPEFLKDQHEDPRSDLYSLGIILYELLMGKLPFTITIKSDDGRKLQRSRIDPEALQALPHPLNVLVTRLLQREPEKRFSSATEALQALTPDLAKQLSRTRTETVVDERRISALLSDARQAMASRNPERARDLLAEAIRLHPNDLAIKAEHDKVNDVIRQKIMADEAVAAGRQALQEQRYDEAVRHLVRAETIAPDNQEITMLVVKARQLLVDANRAKANAQKPQPTTLIPSVPSPPPPEPSPPALVEPEPKVHPQPAPPPQPHHRQPPMTAPAIPPPAQVPWGMVIGLSAGFLAIVVIIGTLLWSKMVPRHLTAHSSASPTQIARQSTAAPHVPVADELDDLLEDNELPANTTAEVEEPVADLDEFIFDNEQTENRYVSATPTNPPVPYQESDEIITEDWMDDDGEPHKKSLKDPDSEAMLVFRTIPSTAVADVYINGDYFDTTVGESDETPPLYLENVAVGLYNIMFVNKVTGEEDRYDKLNIPNKSPKIYELTIEYEPAKPTPEPTPKPPSNIPQPSDSDLEPLPKTSDE